jgi:hypothetical protein
MLISGPEKLNAFREEWDGEAILDLLKREDGRLSIDWPVGVGKSYNIDSVIEATVESGRYDLVIALFPTRRIIDERRWVQNPPDNVQIVNLKPRPSERCSSDFNRRWWKFEKNAMGVLGRSVLCGRCPSRFRCSWQVQYGKSLKGAQIIFGAQAHLERSPYFIDRLIQWSESERPLVIVDEANFIMKTFQRCIEIKKLKMFVDVLSKMGSGRWGGFHEEWTFICDLLLKAPTNDLRSSDWRIPWFQSGWALAVQSKGYDMYGDAFYFPAFDLMHFCRSMLESRERAANGNILFAIAPAITADLLIYSGTSYQQFSEYRLGKDLSTPFKDYRFQHPETVWYNIASRLGMKQNFINNSTQLLDFFAALIVKRLQEGRRPLLIAKKAFCAFIAQEMEGRLGNMGFDVQIVYEDWLADQMNDQKVLPLINYGMIGTNLFQEFDCAYCLTSYYVNEEAVNGILQDVLGSDMGIPLKISCEGRPLRRQVGALHPKDRDYDVHGLSQYALDHLEMGVVLQAVGRVRPYTKPREIVIFQCASHPDFPYTKEFISIGEAREFFGINGRRTVKKADLIVRVQDAKSKGMRQKEAAEYLGVSLRTIQRYWNS